MSHSHFIFMNRVFRTFKFFHEIFKTHRQVLENIRNTMYLPPRFNSVIILLDASDLFSPNAINKILQIQLDPLFLILKKEGLEMTKFQHSWISKTSITTHLYHLG